MTVLSNYATGTVAIAASATSVVGTTTNWTGQNASPGDTLVVAGHQVVVRDVVDATHLTIDAWPFTAVTAGTAYILYKTAPSRYVGGAQIQSVSDLIAALNTTGYFVFVAAGLTVPDPSYGSDGQFAYQPGTGKLWLKISGAWVLQGTFKGFGTPAPWSSVTAYNPFEVVTLAGSSYVCLLPNTNQTPPNVTYWAVLASIGPIGAGYGGSSTTSLSIAIASKVFTTQAGLAYQVGNYVRASSAANGANFQEGFVTAYSGPTLTINVTKIGGSGTFGDWNFAISGVPGSGRQFLSANQAYFVATTGSDSNDGLSSGTPFLTIQKALDVISTLDINVFNVTINVADGTYTGTAKVTGPWLGSGTVNLIGNATTPANVLLNVTGDAITVTAGGRLTVHGFKITTSSIGLYANGGTIQIDGPMVYGANGSYCMFAGSCGIIISNVNFTISGVGGFAALGVDTFGKVNIASAVATISGTPAFAAAFALASQGGLIVANSFTFSGSGATGPRYQATTAGGIFTFGGGANVFPGNSAGSATSPGWYN